MNAIRFLFFGSAIMASVFILFNKYAITGAKATASIFISLLLVAFGNVLFMAPPKLDRPICRTTDADFIPADSGRISRFSKALQLKTVSYKPREYERDEILRFHSFLEKSFPIVHSSPLVTCEKVNELSLLYTVNGTDANMKPYVLAGKYTGMADGSSRRPFTIKPCILSPTHLFSQLTLM